MRSGLFVDKKYYVIRGVSVPFLSFSRQVGLS